MLPWQLSPSNKITYLSKTRILNPELSHDSIKLPIFIFLYCTSLETYRLRDITYWTPFVYTCLTSFVLGLHLCCILFSGLKGWSFHIFERQFHNLLVVCLCISFVLFNYVVGLLCFIFIICTSKFVCIFLSQSSISQ